METADRRKLSNAILTITRLLAAAKTSKLLNRGKIDGLNANQMSGRKPPLSGQPLKPPPSIRPFPGAAPCWRIEPHADRASPSPLSCPDPYSASTRSSVPLAPTPHPDCRLAHRLESGRGRSQWRAQWLRAAPGRPT